MDESLNYLGILKRRWFPALVVFLACLGLGYYRTTEQEAIYQANGQLLLKKNSTSSLTGVGSQLGQLESAIRGNPLENEAAIIKSVPIAERAIAMMGLSETPQQLLDKLNVQNIRGTDILQLSYTDREPEKAANIINTTMKIYIENDIRANRAQTRAAREFIEEQLPLRLAALERAERDLERFKQQNRVLDLKAEAAATVSILNDLDRQKAATQSNLAAQTARTNSLTDLFQVDAQQAVVEGIVGESPTTIPVLGELQEIQKEIEVQKLRFTESHPQVIALRQEEAILLEELKQRIEQSFIGASGRLLEKEDPEQIVQLRPQGLQQGLLGSLAGAEAERLSLEVRLESIDEVAATYRQRANSLPQLELEQRQLERQVQAMETSYNTLLKTFQELLVAENQQVGNATVITPALVPASPLTGRQLIYLVQGAVGGLVLGALTALLLERLDSTVRTSQAARNLVGYSLLSSIPTFPGRFLGGNVPQLIVKNAPDSPASEAFRMLQTNLRFLNQEQPLKAFVVASSVPQEGKSTIAANLAVSMSQLRRRVLLIDGDMRNPSQHKIWKISKEVGLSSVLLGEAELDLALQEVMPNLEVIAAGMPTLNPVALLDSSQMHVLLAYAEQHYDFIIIDSPPLTVAADATILGKSVDGVLLVVRPGSVDSGHVAYSKELLQQANQKVLGLVLNGVSSSNTPAYSPAAIDA